MKKILILLCLFIAISLLTAMESENMNTVIELETEQKISERIEKLLFSFVGKSVVIVDLDLKYPVFRSNAYKGDSKSYYKDDIQKIKYELLKNKIANGHIDQIQIVNMKVTVYLMKSIKSDKVKFVEANVKDWLGLDLKKGDELIINKTLSSSAVLEKSSKTNDTSLPNTNNNVRSYTDLEGGISLNIWLIIIIGLVLSIILILLIVTIRFGIRSLRDSISQMKESKASSSFQIKPERASSSARNSTAILNESKTNPLGINILEDKKEKTKKLPDFKFLENLTNDEFFDLIEKQGLQKNELSYILSVLSVDFINRLLVNDSNKRTNKLVEVMMVETHLQKEKLIELREKIVGIYEKAIDEQIVKIDGKASLVKFINNLPYKKANTIFDRVNELNKKTAEEIRDKVFLFEDIVKLDDAIMKDLIFEIDHEILIHFLASVDKHIVTKFISNMTDRTAAIINEELQLENTQTNEEREIAIDGSLMIIKTILGYI